MFKENIEIIKNTFLEFQGTGMYIALFLVSLLYIYLKEKNNKVKNFLVFYPLVVLLVTLNPIFNKIVSPIFKESTYWRVYWLIPLGLNIAYAAILLIKEQNEKAKKVIAIIGVIAIIMISGKYIYNSENFIKTGNWYKLPDESVRIAQLIGKDTEAHKKAIVPETIIAHIRQIDASIELAYKRDPEGKYENNSAYRALVLGDVKPLTEFAKNNDCNYIVIKKDTVLTIDMKYFGFEKFDETKNYVIYKLVQ